MPSARGWPRPGSPPGRCAANLSPEVIDIGDVAPDIELPATGGAAVRLSEAVKRNRATVIAFYVLDFTPG